jgi:hypothetical protein
MTPVVSCCYFSKQNETVENLHKFMLLDFIKSLVHGAVTGLSGESHY